jgi:hypothetical protein
MTSTLLEVQFPHKMNLVRRATTTTTTSTKTNDPAAEMMTQLPPTTTNRKSVLTTTKSNSRSESFSEPHSDNREQQQQRVIEEKRRRPSGPDGSFTIHKYVVGRMLGKGGFAKVYLCTALDTGKHYAVKVVPKENLVKARARQKVSFSSFDDDRIVYFVVRFLVRCCVYCYFSSHRRLFLTPQSN